MFNTIIIILEAEAITLHTLVINVLNIIQVTFIFAPVSFGFVSNPMYIPNPSVHRVCMLAGWLLHFNFAGPPSSPVLPEISRIVYQWHEIFLYGLGQWGRDTNSVSIHLKFIGNTFKSSESTKRHHSHSISVIEKRSWVVLSKNGSNFFPRPFQRL